jgi:hypothetical protein
MDAASAKAALLRCHIACVESLRRIQDPYELLSKLQFETRGSSAVDRFSFTMRFYPRFLELAASYPPADIDALVTAGRAVFGVCVKTQRANLADLLRRGHQANSPTDRID